MPRPRTTSGSSHQLGGVIHGMRAFLPSCWLRTRARRQHVERLRAARDPHQSAYCASKFAVRGFTEALRHELREHRRAAITVHPGGVKTNIVRQLALPRDDRGQDADRARAERTSRRVARTSPERAAKIIHRGVDRAGRGSRRARRGGFDVLAGSPQPLLRRPQRARALRAPLSGALRASARGSRRRPGPGSRTRAPASRRACIAPWRARRRP